jgi:hypothetical protein
MLPVTRGHWAAISPSIFVSTHKRVNASFQKKWIKFVVTACNRRDAVSKSADKTESKGFSVETVQLDSWAGCIDQRIIL